MKTIEERVNQWAVLPLSDADRRNLMRMALIELADDLNAEHEKEVAAAKSSRRVIIDMLRCDIESKEKKIAELQAWKESALKVMPDFQKLGKLLGLPLGSDVSEPARLKAGAMEDMIADQSALLDEVKSALEYANQLAKQISGDGRGHARFDQLLTRLGGSHE